MTEQSTGIAGIYPGGPKWAVARHDLGDGPVFMEMENEEQAREWHRSMLQAWELCSHRDEIKRPELVATRLHWVVHP